MEYEEIKFLIDEMTKLGFSFKEGEFHRHLYEKTNYYTDIVKLRDAREWLKNPVKTVGIADKDIQVFQVEYDNEIFARHVKGGLLYSSSTGFIDKRLTIAQIEEITRPQKLPSPRILATM
jgi:hypothetical protein